MHIPAHLQDIAKQCALRSWIKGKEFKRHVYFETVDEAKRLLHQVHPDDEPREELVVQIVAAALDEEGALLTYVLATGYTIDGDGDPQQRWLRVCLACGWIVLQAHELAVKNNDWPLDHGGSNG